MSAPFLTATWSNVFLATWAVPPSLLAPRLPPGLALDLRGGDAFVSVVAFEFLDTRLRGLAFPGHRDFAELNLRFYVRNRDERGVVFVREFVPRRAVAWIARAVYNEPYRVAPVSATRDDAPGRHAMRYTLAWAGRTHTLEVSAEDAPFRPAADSDEHFFKEHRWGFGMTRAGRTTRYEVVHDLWDVYPVRSYSIDLDWSAVYGSEWAFLRDAPPISTVLAAGSPVSVWPRRR